MFNSLTELLIDYWQTAPLSVYVNLTLAWSRTNVVGGGGEGALLGNEILRT